LAHKFAHAKNIACFESGMGRTCLSDLENDQNIV
jgi:hypothetical protein